MSEHIILLHKCFSLSNSIKAFTVVNAGLYAFNIVHSYYYSIGLLFPVIGLISAAKYSMRGLYIYSVFLGTDVTIQCIYLYKYHMLWNYFLCFTASYTNILNLCLIYRMEKRIIQLTDNQFNQLKKGWVPELSYTSWGVYERFYDCDNENNI
tara:strand:+ start:4244 stop:4699 length:456 start_codon:yes stop_codon:yes gene_type:complete